MKTKLIILIIFAMSFGMCVSTPNLMANDNQLVKKRERLWNLLQEQKPDYYSDSESQSDPHDEIMIPEETMAVETTESIEPVESVDMPEEPVVDLAEVEDPVVTVDESVEYTQVEFSDGKLVDLQNEFITRSMEAESVQVKTAWADDLSRKTVLDHAIAAMEETLEQLPAAGDVEQEAAEMALLEETVSENTVEVFDDVVADVAEDVVYDMVEDTPMIAEEVVLDSVENAEVEEDVQEVVDQIVEDAQAEIDMTALEDIQVEETMESVQEVALDTTSEAVEDFENIMDASVSDADMDAYEDVVDVSDTPKKKGFWGRLKSTLQGDNEPSRDELNEAFMAEDIEAVDIDSTTVNYGVVVDEGGITAEPADNSFSDYERMKRILNQGAEDAQLHSTGEDTHMTSMQPQENWDQMAAAVNVVREPDSYMADETVDESYIQDVPGHDAHHHPTYNSEYVDSGIEVYHDGEWVDEAAVVHEGVHDEHSEMTTDIYDEEAGEKESFWKKVERKLSMSGMTKEEVAELDYWEVPVQEQTVEDISRNLKIDAAFEEAASVQIDDIPSQKHAFVQPETKISSPREIIRAAIPEANRDRKIDLDFDNTNLSDILLIIGDTGGMNIVLDPALKSNTLDLHLKQISLEEALLLIANSYDLGFKLVGDAIFVTENAKLRYENKVSRIIKVRNVAVQEAKVLVDDLVDKVNASEELNSLIVVGDPKDVAKVEQIIKSIDTPQPQVILVAKIIEVNKDALKDLGVDWSDQINIGYQESGRPSDFNDTEESTGSFYRIAQIQRNPLQFETTIRMLEQQNKAKVLSEPRVTTLNGKEAEIFVGDEVPYTITNITGGVVTNDVRFVEPGIRLRITPSIIEDNFVVMKIEPEVSFIVSFRGPNDEFPQVRTREATAHVRVENKQPFVLGGILNQEDKQNLFKVPFLGKLPLFGNLFSYEKNTAVDTELIITVIPTIVHGKN